jgi:cyclophilin family peptidyl-prolyl cis-trans isomerase
MNSIKTIIKVFVFLLLVSARTCKEKYPELGEGLYAELITTKDTIVVELNYKKVPLTVSNFIGLSEGTHPMLVDSLKGKPYYNGTIFHRVINKFMIQGGDPTATGSGNPGFKFEDEFDESLKHNQARNSIHGKFWTSNQRKSVFYYRKTNPSP